MPGFRVFTLANVPVWVSPWYFIIFFYWMRGDVRAGLLWAGCVTISLLVHEFGHAMVARHFRLSPQVLLHAWGGLCSHERALRDRDDALIIAAGPAAGLLLGGLTFVFSLIAPFFLSPVEYPTLYQAVSYLLWINVIWSLVNLLPIFPLDGGQLFRLGVLRVLKPHTAMSVVHGVSLVLLAGGLAIGLWLGTWFLGVLSALLIWENISHWRAGQAGARNRVATPRIKEMLKSAKAAFQAGDFAEAFRIGQQLRDDGELPASILASLWQILGVSAARIGRFEEALSYLKRAKPTPEITEATIEALHQLDRRGELQVVIESPAFRQISAERREEILAVIR